MGRCELLPNAVWGISPRQSSIRCDAYAIESNRFWNGLRIPYAVDNRHRKTVIDALFVVSKKRIIASIIRTGLSKNSAILFGVSF